MIPTLNSARRQGGRTFAAFHAPRSQAVARLQLHRDQDASGVSGTGIVADGVIFPDGTAVIRWRGDPGSTVVWDSVADAQAVNGHGGATRFVWLD